jgi:hypothetical protein
MLPIDSKIKEWTAHKDIISSISLIDLKERCLITSSLDSYIKVWSLEG